MRGWHFAKICINEKTHSSDIVFIVYPYTKLKKKKEDWKRTYLFYDEQLILIISIHS